MSDWQPCLTCDIVTGRIPVPGGEIYADPHWVVTLGDRLLKRGWVVIASRLHKQRIADLSAEERLAFGNVLGTVHDALQAVLTPSDIATYSFNQVVTHIHFHLVPRFSTDALNGSELVADMFRRDTPEISTAEAELLAERLRIACTDVRLPSTSHLPLPPRVPRDQSPTAPHIPHPEPPRSSKGRYAVEDED